MNLLRSFAAICSLLVIAALPAVAADKNDGYQRLEAFLAGLTGLEAQFHQISRDRAGRVVEDSRGTLAISRPGKFRWDYREPHEQIIVSDGTKVWLYDKDLEQVTVRRFDSTLSSTPAMLLSGDNTIRTQFNVVATTQEGGATWVALEPKRNDTDFKSVRLGFEGNGLRYMELADKLGQTTRLEFIDLKRNPPANSNQFTFVPPPTADVIGDTAG
jgi:outer membrane lipoprotein carrier protein